MIRSDISRFHDIHGLFTRALPNITNSDSRVSRRRTKERMLQLKVDIGLLIDFGNSETRISVLLSNGSRSEVLPNRFALLPSGCRIPQEYARSDTAVFRVGDSYYAAGAFAEREYVGQLMRPSALQQKSEQLVTTLSYNYALIRALTLVAADAGVSPASLEPVFNVSVLLPPLEQETATDKMRALLTGVTSVEACFPLAFSVPIVVKETKVLAEGITAFFAARFDEVDGGLIETPENRDYSSGNVLVIDIGAGTTDVLLVRDGMIVSDSKDTFQLGGNTVEAQLRKLIRQKYGYTPTGVNDIVVTGRIQDGASFMDASDLVTAAKNMYSKLLMTNITSYLERMSMSLREIKGVLVAGGGSLPSVCDGVITSPAMSDVLLSYFRELSPNIALVYVGQKNPRHLNITGLQYIHKFA